MSERVSECVSEVAYSFTHPLFTIIYYFIYYFTTTAPLYSVGGDG